MNPTRENHMQPLNPMDLHAPSTSSDTTLQRQIEAKKAAIRLLGCYRTGDANDPETYISAVICVLARYPIEVIRDATDPATGLPGRLKWLPSIAEIREECEMLAARIAREAEREKRIAEQLEARKALPDMRPRKSYAQLQSELAEVGIYIGRQPAQFDVRAFREKWNISQEQWDSIPNAET